MKNTAAAIGLVLILTVIGAGQTPASADLFQMALTMEKAAGDLEGAIALYQKVVDRGDDEALAAQAQLHIGLCYEKLGLGKAREAYQRVIDRFPRQAEAVKTARDKLALLAEPRAEKPVESRDMKVRRVYDDYGPEWGNALSSDGRYLIYTDWSTGDMAVIDLVTKGRRRITSEGGLDKPGQKAFGETSAFSPDDKRVAYGWQGPDGVNELRVIDFDGTGRRVLYRDENTVWIRPHAWTPDGRNILVNLMRKDATAEIALASAIDGQLKILRKANAKDPQMALSPDGNFIAYSLAPDRESGKRDVFVMKADGSGNEAVVSSPADDYVLGWSPDGRLLVFASDRSGATGIWAVAIKDGRAEGPEGWLKSDVAPDPIRLTQDGTLHYQIFESAYDVFTAPLDPGSGRLLGAPTAVKSARTGIRSGPDWSPDGRRLAYKYFSKMDERDRGRAQIAIYDFGTSEEFLIATGLSSGNPLLSPRWAPDGSSVLLVGSRIAGENGIYQIDIPSGATKLLIQIPPEKICFQIAWSPDGQSVFYTLGNPSKIIRRDLESGQDVEFANMQAPIGLPRIAVSRDGGWLAYTSMESVADTGKLMLAPASGGAAREIYQGRPQFIFWASEGQEIWLKIYKAPADGKGQPTIEFLGVSPDGAKVRKLELGAKQGNNAAPWQILSAMDPRLSPDGRQVAFWAGQSKLEVWALENFLPRAKAK
jgi:Tol biopolymer transport system component